MWEIRQNDLNNQKIQIFPVFEILIDFYVNLSSNFEFQQQLSLVSKRFLKKHLQFLRKVSQMTSTLS